MFFHLRHMNIREYQNSKDLQQMFVTVENFYNVHSNGVHI